LAEATALIQRTLGGGFAPPEAPEEPIETARRALNEASRPTAPSRPGPTEHGLRRAPRPSRHFRGVPRMPGVTPGARPEHPAPATDSAGGRFVERSYTNGAGTRAYKLYVPSGYVGQEVSLIVMLHGCTQSPDDIAAGTRMNALAEEHTFLVAYPAQAQGANMNKCWNWFKAEDQRRGRGEPSIIAGITCEVIGEYHVDPGRVYVAGMSAGGAMAAIMGATYPDLFAAVGVHSGLAPGAAGDLSSAFSAMQGGGPATARRDVPAGESARVVPAILFHGDRDKTVHPRNADRLLAHYWAATGAPTPQATTSRGQVPGGHAYTRATYHDAGGRAIVELWTVHGLGHAWSGGSLPGSYTDPMGPDASAEMVRFFHQQKQQEPMARSTD
ncbi:MAG: PHB depolymerase family esterase, partial [Actinomycetota bacterium]|nr:PHB depolymerase family esterase [Actinomycetota bacterium]